MSEPRHRSVLLVEDDDVLCRVIGRNLTQRGVAIRRVPTAGDALAAVVDARPDLLILDINLPDQSGWDLLRALKARDIKLPTIVISAARAAPERLAEFGCIAHLPKPFPLDALLRLILHPANEPTAEAAR